MTSFIEAFCNLVFLLFESADSVICSAGNNCLMNKMLSDLFHRPLLEFCDQRFLFFVNDSVMEMEEGVSSVYHISIRLHNLTLQARLRQVTNLDSLSLNKTQ